MAKVQVQCGHAVMAAWAAGVLSALKGEVGEKEAKAALKLAVPKPNPIREN